MLRTFSIVIMFSILFSTTMSFAAQSSADVPVSTDMKVQLLKEIRSTKSMSLQSDDEYIVGHGDILTVSIFEEGDMAASSASGAGRAEGAADTPRPAGIGTPVRMDGRMSLRDIGDVEVVGLTLTELADYLKKLFAVIYEDPIVTTTLVQSNSLRYTVMGQVNGPGVFFLDYPMTLVQVVARSGGFTEWAGKELTVVRKQLKKEDTKLFDGNTLEFDYGDFISGKALDKNIFVRPGDIIIID